MRVYIMWSFFGKKDTKGKEEDNNVDAMEIEAKENLVEQGDEALNQKDAEEKASSLEAPAEQVKDAIDSMDIEEEKIPADNELSVKKSSRISGETKVASLAFVAKTVANLGFAQTQVTLPMFLVTAAANLAEATVLVGGMKGIKAVYNKLRSNKSSKRKRASSEEAPEVIEIEDGQAIDAMDLEKSIRPADLNNLLELPASSTGPVAMDLAQNNPQGSAAPILNLPQQAEQAEQAEQVPVEPEQEPAPKKKRRKNPRNADINPSNIVEGTRRRKKRFPH